MLVTGASVGAELYRPSPVVTRHVLPTVPVATSSAPNTACSAYSLASACAEVEGNVAVETVRVQSSETDNLGSYFCSYVRTGKFIR